MITRMTRLSWTAAVLLLAAVVWLGIGEMSRGLWLDEAWVANSIREPSLAGMFYYPGWLQTSPPLFLLLSREVVRLIGDLNTDFRVIPLIFSILSAAFLFATSRLLLRPALAILATAIVMFDQTAIDYSHTFKPYSGELAASAALLLATIAYLQRPEPKRFMWMLTVVAIAMPLSYPAVFLLPGIILAVAFAIDFRHSLFVGTIAAMELALMFWLTIRPNLSPELHEFWMANRAFSIGLVVALAFCVAAAFRLMMNFTRRAPSARDWAYVICLLPCLLLATAALMGWYPVSHRTRLFVLPCFVLLASMTAEDLLGRVYRGPLVEILALGGALVLGVHAIVGQSITGHAASEEDFASVVSFLETHAGAPDLILVHACCKEGFELYRQLDDWDPPHLEFGDTGYPCCVRGKNARPGSSSEGAVIADLDSKVPRGYSGRVWLVFATRPTHWDYTGLDEGELWRKHLWERGCPPGPFLRFANLAISPMDCASAR